MREAVAGAAGLKKYAASLRNVSCCMKLRWVSLGSDPLIFSIGLLHFRKRLASYSERSLSPALIGGTLC